MNKSGLKKLIRETVYNLLEEDTKFSEGERVIDNKGKTGIISLSKHPFYAVKLDSTGTTHSYHFTDLMKNEDIDGDGDNDYGKYNTTSEPKEPLQESSPSEIIIMNGLLNVQDGLNVGDVLSDIRSISGVTIVRPIDIPGESHKSKLVIKINPFPFKGKSEDEIKEFIKTSIRKIPGVKEFFTNTPEPTNEIRFRIK